MPEPTIYSGTFTQCVDAFVQNTLEEKCRDALRPIVALVGSNAMRQELRERLHKGGGGILGVYCLTFKDLVEKLGSSSFLAAGKRPVEKLYHLAMIQRLIKKKSLYFKNVAQYEGTSQAIFQTFEDIREAGWETIPVRRDSSDKIKDMASIFDTLRDTFAQNDLYTLHDLFDAACKRASSFRKFFPCDQLRVIGLYDLNSQQDKLLTELAAHIQIHYYIPRVAHSSNWAKKKNIEESSIYIADAQRTTILSAPSPLGEVREIIREAKKLRHRPDSPIPYHKMGVLVRHMAEYADLFANICAEAEIPCKIHGGCSPTDSRALRLLTGLTGLIDFTKENGRLHPNLKRADTVTFLDACRLRPGSAWPANIREMQRRWNHISRDAHIRKGKDWDRQLKNYPKKNKGSALLESADALGSAVAVLSEGLSKIAGAKSFLRAATHFESLAKRFIEADESCKTALESLETLKHLDDAHADFDPLRFKSLLLQMIHEVKDVSRCADPEGLQVMDMSASRGLRFDVAFIPGCVEGMIPHLGRPDPILLDKERIDLNKTHRDSPLPLFSNRPENERSLFDSACLAASKQLILTFHRSDAGTGKPKLPSHYLLNIFGGATPMDDFIRDHVMKIPSGAPAAKNVHEALSGDEKDLVLMKSLAAVDAAGPVSFLRKSHLAFERAWRKQLHRWAEREIGPWEGLCAGKEAKRLLADRLKKSKAFHATKIEAYVKCPRRYMFENILKLQRPETPEEVVSLPANKRGTLIHQILSELEQERLTQDEWIARVKKKYGAYIDDNLTGGGALDEIEAARLIAWIKLFEEMIDENKSVYKSAQPEKRIEVDIAIGGQPKTPFRLAGRLDRLDSGEGGHERIIDFKTGKSSDSLLGGKGLADDSFNAGATLQIPLYMLAMTENAAKTEKVNNFIDISLEAAYWHLKDKDGNLNPQTIKFSNEFIQKSADELKNILREVVEGMRAGHFVPRPDVAINDAPYCTHCDYKNICDGLSRKFIAYNGLGQKNCPWLARLTTPAIESKK
jgi:RecB family exonuclease